MRSQALDLDVIFLGKSHNPPSSNNDVFTL